MGGTMKQAARGIVTDLPADRADWQTDDPIVPGFTIKHPPDEKEQAIWARHRERVTYLRREYQRRMVELNTWYERQQFEVFGDLVQELEAINR